MLVLAACERQEILTALAIFWHVTLCNLVVR